MAREHPTTTEERALELLGTGSISPEQVAIAIGVTPSYISQLLSDEKFSAQVTALRYQNLQKHNARDDAYDALEDTLIDKLEKAVPFMSRPMEILKSIQVINGAKRRGVSSPESITNQQNVIPLLLPTTIVNKFTTNINNQVIQVGEQSLATLPTSKLLEQADDRTENKIPLPDLKAEGS